MSGNDEDDKPTVVLDLNALKKQKVKQEEELASIGDELEFNLIQSPELNFPVILFDFNSDFFSTSFDQFPIGPDYRIVKELADLTAELRQDGLKIVVFNYDSNAKVVNQLSAQIKLKFPQARTLIIAKNISPEKAKIHQQSKAGANGYYQLPLEKDKIQDEFLKIYQDFQEAS